MTMSGRCAPNTQAGVSSRRIRSARIPPSSGSEHNSRLQLNRAFRDAAGSCGHLAEVSRSRVGDWCPELRPIEQVQRICTNLKIQLFANLEHAMNFREPDIDSVRAEALNARREDACLKTGRLGSRCGHETRRIEPVVQGGVARR